MTGDPFGIVVAFIIMICTALVISWLISMVAKWVMAHLHVGERARDKIVLMWHDKDYNRGIRPVAVVLYYLISWASYISMLIAFFTGIWVIKLIHAWDGYVVIKSKIPTVGF